MKKPSTVVKRLRAFPATSQYMRIMSCSLAGISYEISTRHSDYIPTDLFANLNVGITPQRDCPGISPPLAATIMAKAGVVFRQEFP